MESSVCINEEMSVLDDINKDNYNHPHQLGAIFSVRDYIDLSSDKSKVDVDITPINSRNDTNIDMGMT